MNRAVTTTLSILAFSAIAAAQDRPGITTRVSVNDAGDPADDVCRYPAISDDGRYVAFASEGTNLVAGDTNGKTDVFVRDRLAGTTERVSVSTAGVEGDGFSSDCEMTPDGRYVVFSSTSTNLVPGDTNGFTDVFVRDRTLGTTERVSVAPGGIEGDAGTGVVGISNDGRWAALISQASNLVPNDTNGLRDMFLADRTTGALTRISLDPAGNQLANGISSQFESFSGDGRHAVFITGESLVPEDTNSTLDLYLRDVQLGTTELVSVTTAGVSPSAGAYTSSISEDGRYVAFSTLSSDVVPGDTNGVWDVFVRDRTLGTTRRISVTSSGKQGNLASGQNSGGARMFGMSATGRYVAFKSFATNFAWNDFNGVLDVFLYDLEWGVIERVSVSTDGTENDGNASLASSVTPDGRFVAFAAHGTVLDPPGGGERQIYVRERLPVVAETYCVGKVNSQGCTPAMAFSGTPSATSGSGFVLSATDVLNNKVGILAYSLFGAEFKPFQGGFLCARSPLKRTPLQNSGGNPPPNDCSGVFAFDFNAYAASGANPELESGREVWAQFWSRDSGVQPASSLSNAAHFELGP